MRTEKNKSQKVGKVVGEIMEEYKNSHSDPEVNVAQYFVIFKIQRTECKNKAAHGNIFYESSFTVQFTVTEAL